MTSLFAWIRNERENAPPESSGTKNIKKEKRVERSRNPNVMIKRYMYILKCSDDSYYTGSTKDLDRRMEQHQNGEGANHTKKRLPVELVYYETYSRIDWAFEREKQVQGWSRSKKQALINGELEELNGLAECKNQSHYLIQKSLRLRSASEQKSINEKISKEP